ncbi:AMP-binding enzyme [Aquihabitans sp. McL0605]|uniref:AMP-binding enzyme n=1 Tax=Aquihabitans sp. McL0605 TaxID=3415671 RepID=UPI003CEC0042
MARLVAISTFWNGPVIERMVRTSWDRGDAVLMVPGDLPSTARQHLLAATAPSVELTCDDDGRITEAPTGLDAPPLDDGDALVVVTSGSTGVPKVLVHTHRSLRAHADAVHEHLGVDPARDRWLACLPLNHLGGFGVLARSILTATPVDVLDGFDERAVTAAPAERGSTLVSLVATALDRVEADPYRWVVLGGSADPTPRPSNVVHTYGLTETGGGVVYEGVALPGVEVRVDPPSAGARAGAIALRTPTTARGRRGPDGSTSPLVGPDGWLATGDLGRWSDDGRLLIDGRADDLIITGGENVWPLPVEEAIRTHGQVADVMVHGALDPEWGQRVVAVVVPADPSSPPTLEALRGHVKQTLPASSAPRALRLVDVIPRTALGKPRRPVAPPPAGDSEIGGR